MRIAVQCPNEEQRMYCFTLLSNLLRAATNELKLNLLSPILFVSHVQETMDMDVSILQSNQRIMQMAGVALLKDCFTKHVSVHISHASTLHHILDQTR